MKYGRSLVLGGILGLTFAVVFASGFMLRDLLGPKFSPSFPVNASAGTDTYHLLNEMQHLLDTVYLGEQPDVIVRQYAAIRGVLSTLEDRNTFFIEPPVAQSEADVLAGTYGGAGILVRRDEQGRLLLYPYEDSPAQLAGISEGSELIAINGEPVDINTQPDILDQKLRGEVTSGNGVDITYRVMPDGEQITTFVEFAVINVPSLVWYPVQEDPTIGYIHIMRFTARTPGELDYALIELSKAGAEALILDLRKNNGGLLEESISVASRFLDSGIIAYEINRAGEREFEVKSDVDPTALPLVVLVNQNTASASELVAAALQDRDRAIVIGQQTFGKGTVQQIFTLSDGSSIHITSAEWLTPDRSPLDGVGLAPDITMIPDESGRDVEMGEAIRHLNVVLSSEEAGE